jgi:hypothetical protein
VDSAHTLDCDEVARLHKLREAADSPHVFVSERGGPISADMVARVVAETAGETGRPARQPCTYKKDPIRQRARPCRHRPRRAGGDLELPHIIDDHRPQDAGGGPRGQQHAVNGADVQCVRQRFLIGENS